MLGVETLVAPGAALLGTALGAWLLDHYSGRRWLRQQQWAAREKRYIDLLVQLTKAELALQAQDEYYMEPGSQHVDHSKSERFMQLGSAAAEALRSVEELAGPAQVFLSQKAIDALRELVREDWNAAFGSAHPGEYIEKALSLVQNARATVVTEAKTQLNGSAA
jgi:hypothetical protein